MAITYEHNWASSERERFAGGKCSQSARLISQYLLSNKMNRHSGERVVCVREQRWVVAQKASRLANPSAHTHRYYGVRSPFDVHMHVYIVRERSLAHNAKWIAAGRRRPPLSAFCTLCAAAAAGRPAAKRVACAKWMRAANLRAHVGNSGVVGGALDFHFSLLPVVPYPVVRTLSLVILRVSYCDFGCAFSFDGR